MLKQWTLKRWIWTGLFLSLMVGICADAAEVPLEVYGSLPTLENVTISPDGTRIALVKSQNGERLVFILSIADRKMLSLFNVGEVKLRDILWADNDHLLLVTSTTSPPPQGYTGRISEVSMLQSYDIAKEEFDTPLTVGMSFRDRILNIIIDGPSIRRINGQTIVFVEGVYVSGGRGMAALFKLNLTTNRSDIVTRGNRNSRGWLVDENGEIMASQSYNDKTHLWELEVRKDGKLVEAASGKAAIECPTLAGFSPEGDAIWVRTVENDDPIWKSISLKSGVMGEQLPETKGFRTLGADPYTSQIVGGRTFSGDDGFVFFDPLENASWEALKNKCPGEHVDIVSASSDHRKMVVRADGPQHGYAYYLVDLASLTFSPIGDVYDGLTRIAEVRPIVYPATDGMKIPGYLTLPMDCEANKLPLIVMPHGGPAVRDTGRFDWWAQALASRGYAVLQPNYRGSRLDWEFMSAGFGEWGRKMQTDLSDGVRYLVKEGTVDADRVCIVGASYGGYAALAGATLDTGIYRCAISVGGISDLRLFTKWKKLNSYSLQGLRYLDRYFGATGPSDPILKILSPLEYAEKVSIPVMLIHGRDDTVVPFGQSERMADALEGAKKTVELVELKQEDHWLSKSDTRLQMLQDTLRFLKTHNPPD